MDQRSLFTQLFFVILKANLINGLCSSSSRLDELHSSNTVLQLDRNASSIVECIVLCSKQTFCKSVIYNTAHKTCSLYKGNNNCREHSERDRDGLIVLVSCINGCEKINLTSELKDLSEEIRRELNYPLEAPRNSPLKETIDEDHSTDALNSSYDYKIIIERSDGQQNKINVRIGNNRKDPEINEPKLDSELTKNSGEINRTGLKTESMDLLRTHPEKPTGHHYTIHLKGISGQGQQKITLEDEPNSRAFNSLSRKVANYDCFASVKNQFLLNAGYKMFTNVSLTDCKCACKQTWIGEKENQKCKSFQYNDIKQCLLNHDDHQGKYDLVYDYTATYYYITCNMKESIYILQSECNMDQNSLKAAKSKKFSNQFTNSNYLKARQLNIFDLDKNRLGLFPKKKSEIIANRDNLKSVPVENHPEVYVDSPRRSPINRNSKSNTDQSGQVEKLVNDDMMNAEKLMMLPSIKSNPTRTEEEKRVDEIPKKSPNKINTIFNDPESRQTIDQNRSNHCFEIIEEHTLMNLAGGLEHNVSIEECQCFCATSKKSRRYSFQCLSATYYHTDRDCVLNLNDRFQRFDQFVANKKVSGGVSYIGLSCNPDDAIAKFSNGSHYMDANKCRQLKSSAANKSSSSEYARHKSSSGVHTDECFVELPDKALGGTAFAVETNVTLEQCKCFCIDAEARYGHPCLSLQYFFDSMTCLLDDKNRATNPDDLNSLNSQSSYVQSYFDYQCTEGDHLFSMYIDQICSTIIDTNHFGDSSSADYRKRTTSSETESTTSVIYSTKYVKTPSVTNKPNKMVESSENGPTEQDYYEEEPSSTPDDSEDTTPSETETTTLETDSNEKPQIAKYDFSRIGHCTYSAIYQSLFLGMKLIKRLSVANATQCFVACYYENCRSANLLFTDDSDHICELYRDSQIDYRTSDVLVFEKRAVYFDGIRCIEKSNNFLIG